MAQSRISNAAAIAALKAVTDRLNAGAGSGLLRIYSEPQPAGVDVAITTQTLLVEFVLDDPAFADPEDADPGAIALANPIPNVDAIADGLAAWYRAVDSDGTAVLDGDVGEDGSEANLILDSTTIGAGVEQTINQWAVTMAEG